MPTDGAGGQLTHDGAEQHGRAEQGRGQGSDPTQCVDPLTEDEGQDCRHPAEEHTGHPPAPGVPRDRDDAAVLVHAHDDDDPSPQREHQTDDRDR